MSLAYARADMTETKATAARRERELVERAQREREAFATLYRQYRPLLLDYVYRRTGDVHVTEDLVADTFLIVLRSLAGYRSRGVPLRFWLLRIATNVVNRWARQHRKRLMASLASDLETADSGSSHRGGQEQLLQALLTLPPRYQAVLALHHGFPGGRLEELVSVKDPRAITAAILLGCREGTVRSRLARARDALRTQLTQRR